MSAFLTAQWKDLINLTYEVNPGLLKEYVPKGLELEVRKGKSYVSLVAFEFKETRLKGLKVPYHVNFPEINLRFYVRQGSQRGVVFIKELVPRIMLAKVANWAFNEPYECFRMEYDSSETDGVRTLVHRFGKHSLSNTLTVEVGGKTVLAPQKTKEWFFKEHEWGYGQTKKGKSLIYRVKHPEWRSYPNVKVQCNVDFEEVYGPKWGFLSKKKPFLKLVAVGSEVTVFSPKSL